MSAKHREHLPDLKNWRVEQPGYEYPLIDRWAGKILERSRIRTASAVQYECGPDWAMEPRRVVDDMFFLVTQGSGRIWVEERETRLRPGVCAHFRRGITHAADTSSRNPIVAISIHYSAMVYESLSLPEVLAFPDAFRSSRTLETLALEACRIFQKKPCAYQRVLDATLTHFMFRLLWECGHWLSETDANPLPQDLGRLQPALERMQHNLSEPLPIGELAQLAGLSESQFRRIFRRALGASPVAHLRRIRMEEACRRLRETRETVESVGANVGYAETSFFSRTFKAMVGCSPGRYRDRREL